MTTMTENLDPKIDTQPRISPDDYRRIVEGMKLIRLSLRICEAKANLEVLEGVFPQPLSLSVDMREIATKLEPRDGGATIRHGYLVTSKCGRKTAFSIRAVYTLTFESAETVTEEFFEVFRQITLPRFTWPYMRELVASMTGRMDMPKLLLPLIHA